MEPLPFNITLSSQTATISYLPTRDGDAALGWNVTYSQGNQNTGYSNLQGVGTDTHRTAHDGASLQFSWIGTAVYLYGNADNASYTLDVDGDRVSSSSVTIPEGGLLGSKTGLEYGNHTVTLTTHGTNQVAFQFAELTIGLGYLGSSVQNSSILAVDSSSTPITQNPFFSYQPVNNHWHVEVARTQLLPNGTRMAIPRQMLTSTLGESVSFTINQTSAFFLYGSCNRDHAKKVVTVTPYGDPSKAWTTTINDHSSILDFFQIIHWEAGLDRDESYNVQIIQAGLPPNNLAPNFGFHSLVTIDGGSAPQSSNATHPSGSPDPSPPGDHPSSTRLGSGVVVAVVVSGAAVLAILAFVLFWLRRQRRRRRFASRPREILSPTPEPGIISRPGSIQTTAYMISPFTSDHWHSNSQLISSSNPSFVDSSTAELTQGASTPDAREVDAGPLPPEYQASWMQNDLAGSRRMRGDGKR
ncbi:hypothetical protein BXZ70DRAFT_180298 [Cristinia sonorae]|uniref:Uncharacterized protein n=1 Tax=Cristinia sonorae TaxID=1940300 RepID=A0A8K0XPH5_9AGAR|nr:hypothetical protein BXZ70DRAFT_180298 [Cristinia sonorae]